MADAAPNKRFDRGAGSEFRIVPLLRGARARHGGPVNTAVRRGKDVQLRSQV
jgi:hypothetical protein